MALTPLNSVTLEGKLTKDVSVRSYDGKEGKGGRLAFGSIKSLRAGKKKDGTDSFSSVNLNFTAFGWTADSLKDLKKDDVVILHGSLENNSYTSKKTNIKVYEVKLMVDRALKVERTTKAVANEEEEVEETAATGSTPDNSWMD